MSGPRRVTEFLAPGGSPLSDLVRTAARRSRLDRALGEFLDRPLREQVHVASASDGVLVLAAETPVWGHRIRYLAPAILEQLRERDPGLSSVRIIVRPTRHDPEPRAAVRREALAPSTASMLKQVAAACDNPELARVLERLARRSR